MYITNTINKQPSFRLIWPLQCVQLFFFKFKLTGVSYHMGKLMTSRNAIEMLNSILILYRKFVLVCRYKMVHIWAHYFQNKLVVF